MNEIEPFAACLPAMSAITEAEASLALAALARHHGLPDLPLDEDTRTAAVQFGEEYGLLFQYHESTGLTLWAPLCSLELAESAAEERQLLRYALGLGAPGGLLNGAYVTLNEEGLLLLVRPLHLTADAPEAIIACAEAFALQAVDVIGRLRAGDWAGAGLQAGAAPSETPLGIRI